MSPGIRGIRPLLRCVSCRFAALYFVPFCAGLTLAGRATFISLLLAAIFSFVFSTSVEVTNRLSDRTEDAVNRPERTALCAMVGWRRLRVLEVLGWSAVAGLDVIWLYRNPSPLLAGLLLSAAVLGIGYSRGPRLARRRYLALAVLNLVFAAVFVLGWAAGTSFTEQTDPRWGQLASFAPLAVVVGSFVVTLAGIKDLTDRRGDSIIGYRSVFLDMLDRRPRRLKLLAAVPFALVGVFALSGLLASRLLALVALAPCSMLLVEMVLKARTPRERLVVRELFYCYWFIFASASLLLFTPGAALALVTVGAAAYWVLATKWLHWAPVIVLADVRDLIGAPAIRRREAAVGAWRS